MADDEPTIKSERDTGEKKERKGGGKDDGKTAEEKKHTKQTRILIIIGAVGLLLTYILLRKSSSGSSTATDTGTADALTQYEQQNQADLGGLASELNSIQGEVTGMMAGAGTIGNTNPTTSATTPTSTPAAVPGTTPGQVLAPDNTLLSTAQAPQGTLDILGTITGSSLFSGENVSGGAPVFANVGGTWEEGFNPALLPIGTQLATPDQFRGNIGNPAINERL